jgi:ankyrin repeat protein
MKTTSDKNTLEVAIRRKDGTKILEIIRSQESVEDHVLAEIISRMGASDPVTVSAIIIDQKSKFSPNALGLAVISALKEGQGQIASLIMDDGIVLTSAQDANGITPLTAAAANGEEDFARKYLMGRISTEGVDALIAAAKANNEDFIQLLLENGVNVDAVNKTGATALMYAAENGNLYVIEFLLQKGADVNVKNKDGKSALMIIVDSGNLDLLQTLIDNKLGAKALKYAITSVNLEMVKACLDQNVSVVDEDRWFHPILSAAVASKDLNIMNMIFSKVHNPALLGSELELAIANGDLETVEFLVGRGANISKTNIARPPICIAIAEGHTEIIDFLLAQEELDLNAFSGLGTNPLNVAAEYNRADILRKMLFVKGADPYIGGTIGDFYISSNGKYAINPHITDEESKQVIAEYLTLEREFREKFADKAKEKIANYKGNAPLENAYKEINITLKDLLQDDEKKFASTFSTEQIKIKLNFVDKFIIELKELLGLANKLDATQERIMIRLEEKIYEAIKNSELFKKLSPELEGNVSVAKALDGIQGRFSKAGNIESGEKSKAEKVTAERANKTNTEGLSK